ncbi:hypothetical protein AB1Y20_019607 [Prymnesium parvum]|uniref:J domain-containing protein n=1 Tax=Prymnesium parvum TaxID=97485 RepID=A0AB34JWD4_PRYPA
MLPLLLASQGWATALPLLLAPHGWAPIGFPAGHALHPARPVARRAADVSLAFSVPRFGRNEPPAGPPEEIQALFRLLGLAEDATYDEVTSAYEELASKYKGETKRLIKLQVAKDKILDFRLKQRMTGALKVAEAFGEDRYADQKKPLITLPPFLESVMELPSKEALTKNAIVFGVIGLLPMLSLSWASTSVSLGFAVALYLLYNRGAPDTGNDMDAAMRPPKVRPLLLSVGITFLMGAIGATVSQLVYGLVSFLPQQVVIAVSTSFFFGIAATFFKVQEN